MDDQQLIDLSKSRPPSFIDLASMDTPAEKCTYCRAITFTLHGGKPRCTLCGNIQYPTAGLKQLIDLEAPQDGKTGNA